MTTMSFIQSDYLKTLKQCIILIGIWKSEESRVINKPKAAFIILLLFFVPIDILTNYKQYRNMLVATETLLLTLIMFHSLVTYIIFVIYQEIICDNICIMEERFSNFEKQLIRKTDFQKMEENIFMIFYRVLSFNFVGVVTVYAVTPFCCGHLPYILLLPYIDEGSFAFPYVTYVAMILVSLAQASVQITTTVVCGGCLNMAIGQIKILGEAYKNVSPKTPRCERYKIQKNSDEQIMNTIKRNVDHYNLVLRFCKQTFKIFSIILLLQFVIAEVIACYCLFQLYEGIKMMSLHLITSGLLMLTSITIHAFISFYSGERLSSTSSEFQNDLYSSDWYTSSVKVRRMLIIVAECHKQPITFKAGSIVPITLSSFVTAVKAAVSYFNILLALTQQMDKK